MRLRLVSSSMTLAHHLDFLLLFFVNFLFQDFIFWVLEILRPAAKIDRAIEFDLEKYKSNPDAFGDHKEWIDKSRDPVLKKTEKK